MSINIELFKQHKNGFLPILIEVHIADMTFYLCNNNEPITYQGQEYVPYWFKFERPIENSDTDGSATITISTIDTQFLKAIRMNQSSTPYIVYKALWCKNPLGEIEFYPLEGYNFLLADCNVNVKTATFTLSLNLPIMKKFPRIKFNTWNNAGSAS